MKKLFAFLLALVIMCLFTCNTAATEAVVEMTRYDTDSLKDFSDIVNDKTIEEHGLLERRKEDEEKSLNTLAYLSFNNTVLCASGNYSIGYYVEDVVSNGLRNLYLFGSNSCLAGSSGEMWRSGHLDLVGMIYRKGAHFAFATTRVSGTPKNEAWAKHFMDCLLDGKSFYEAIQNADHYLMNIALQSGDSGVLCEVLRVCSRHYAGDSSIVLYHG